MKSVVVCLLVALMAFAAVAKNTEGHAVDIATKVNDDMEDDVAADSSMSAEEAAVPQYFLDLMGQTRITKPAEKQAGAKTATKKNDVKPAAKKDDVKPAGSKSIAKKSKVIRRDPKTGLTIKKHQGESHTDGVSNNKVYTPEFFKDDPKGWTAAMAQKRINDWKEKQKTHDLSARDVNKEFGLSPTYVKPSDD
jgi:hypothetical protein